MALMTWFWVEAEALRSTTRWAISADGTLVAAQNYTPGGVKVFDARTLELVADIPAEYAPGKRSRVVGLADVPGNRFIFALFDADAIWVADLSDRARPAVTRIDAIGRQPYDALVTPDGRHYIAGLFGEDGLALVDLWDELGQTGTQLLVDWLRRPWIDGRPPEPEPQVGEPTPQNFVDNASLDGSRLFGQGAEIDVKKYNIINKPSCD